MRRYADAPGGMWDQPPDTDPAPVPCTNCGRLDCDCGDGDDSARDDAMEAEAER